MCNCAEHSDGRGYTVRQLIETHRAAKAWPQDAPFIRVDWCTVLTAREWLAWFRERLLMKIQYNGEGTTRSGWRKMQREWQVEMDRAARALNTPRLVIHWLPPDLKTRFAHRLYDSR